VRHLVLRRQALHHDERWACTDPQERNVVVKESFSCPRCHRPSSSVDAVANDGTDLDARWTPRRPARRQPIVF